MTHAKQPSTILYPLAEKGVATSKLLTHNLGTNFAQKQNTAGITKTSILYTASHKDGSFDKSLQKGSVQQSRNKDVKKSKSISDHEAIGFHIMNKKPDYFRYPNSGANSIEVSKINLHALKEEKGENADYFSTNNSKIKEKAINHSEIYLPESATATPRPFINSMNSTLIRDNLSLLRLENKSAEKQFHEIASPYGRGQFRSKPWKSGLLPHGDSTGKQLNEERLNVLNEGSVVKVSARSPFQTIEKSIDLSERSDSEGRQHQQMLTQTLINNNKLSKYLTSFVGKKDFRTTEERELAKCTFNPKLYPKHRRYKAIKGKLSSYISGINLKKPSSAQK